MHNLTWDTAKRRWKIRLTVGMGTKVVGRRVKFNLNTPDVEQAIAVRDGVIHVLRQLGVTVEPRKQRRPCDDPEPLLLPCPESEPTPEP